MKLLSVDSVTKRVTLLD